MNYCMPDMYEVPHAGMGGYTVQGSGEHCMYAGEGPGYRHCEPQPLHHPPCMEQTSWPPSQHYSCSYAGGPPVFKSEFCSMEIPLSHFHHQPEYLMEIKPDISHLQWMQGVHKRGTACRSWGFTGVFSRFNGVEFDLTDEIVVFVLKNMFPTFLIISDDNSVINNVWDFQMKSEKYKSAVRRCAGAGVSESQCWTEAGYWLMLRRQKADARLVIAFLTNSTKVLISMLTSGLGDLQRSKRWAP